MAFISSGVLPTDGEGLQIAFQRELDDAFLGCKVEHIELVDLWRDDEQRPRIDLIAHRAVLD